MKKISQYITKLRNKHDWTFAFQPVWGGEEEEYKKRKKKKKKRKKKKKKKRKKGGGAGCEPQITIVKNKLKNKKLKKSYYATYSLLFTPELQELTGS